MTAQIIANLADALDGDGQAFQAVGTVQHLGGCLDALPHADGGVGRGVAADSGQTADVLGLAGHNDGVVAGGVHILGGDVAAAQGIDSLTKGLEHSLGLLAGVGHNDSLAAAEVQTGCCVLVGHTTAQAHNIKQSILGGSVGPQTAAADGGASDGVMYGDDGLQASLFIIDEQDLFVAAFAHGFH